MPKHIVTPCLTKNNPLRQPKLPAFLSRQIDAVLWLEENTQDQLVKSFAGIARRRLEAMIPTAESAP